MKTIILILFGLTLSSAVSAQEMKGMDMKMPKEMKSPKVNVSPIKTVVNNTAPRVVRYDLHVAETLVNLSGKSKRAIAVNGSIPMPTLTFTEGDIAEIYVHNDLDEETSIARHEHGK